MRRALEHAAIVFLALAAGLGVPYAYFAEKGTLGRGDTDAVSGATLVVPDQPSGSFFVLLNTSRHPGTWEEWTNFFSEKEVDVIMEDIHCLLPAGDVSGKELADRYQARLAENQMTVKTEDGTLVVSRAEQGLFDVVILSAEAEAVYDYSQVFAREDVAVIQAGSNA